MSGSTTQSKAHSHSHSHGSFVFRATHAQRCPICHGTHSCSATDNGLHFCRRCHYVDQPGFRYLGEAAGGTWGMYRSTDDDYKPPVRPITPPPPPRPRIACTIDWDDLHHWGLDRPERTEKLAELAALLGVTVESLDQLGCVWLPCVPAIGGMVERCWDDWQECWAFPERDGTGMIVGMIRRFPDGGKFAIAGSQRGLSCDLDGWADDERTVYLPEGPTDTAAMASMGMRGIGRPSNVGGVSHLAQILRGLDPDIRIVVLGERDRKSDGSQPGLDGALSTARALSEALHRPVEVQLPPVGYKDVRAWLVAHPEAIGGTDRPELVPVKTFDPPPAPQPPTPPVQPDDRRAELARKILECRHDHQTNPCSHLRRPILMDRSNFSPHLVEVRCERWGCDGCRRCLCQRELLSAEWHFGEATHLYQGYCTADEWRRVAKCIQRRGKKTGVEAEYLRLKDGSGYVYWTNVDIAGATLVEVAPALDFLRGRLAVWDQSRRPISTSHGWSLLPPEKPSSGRFSRIGEAMPDMTLTDLEEISAAYTAAAMQSDGPRHPKVQSWVSFVRAGTWTEDMVRDLADDLARGRPKPPGDRTPFEDDRRRWHYLDTA